MAWSPPRTWNTGDRITYQLLNQEIRDNLRYLKGLDGPIALNDALTVYPPSTAVYGLGVQRATSTHTVSLVFTSETGGELASVGVAGGAGALAAGSAQNGLVLRSATHIKLAAGTGGNNFAENQLTLWPDGSLIHSRTGQSRPFSIDAYPTTNDLTIRTHGATGRLILSGRGVMYLAHNVYTDGTSDYLWDTSKPGTLLVMNDTVPAVRIYNVTAGANPRTPAERARIADPNGGLNAHLFYSNSGTIQTDWPAGWDGGIGTRDISARNIYYNTLTQRSRDDLKESVRPLEAGALEKVRRLRPIRFRWKEDGREAVGLSASDVAALIPELAAHDEDGQPVGWDLGGLVAHLLRAVQELAERVEALERRR